MRTHLSALVALSAAGIAAAAPVDFAKDVQPILTASCVNCHGPNKAKSGVRVDSLDALTKSGVVTAGSSAKSTLFRCLNGADGTAKMPPKGQLTQAQMATIKDWIDQGAKPSADAKADTPVAKGDAKPAEKPAKPDGKPAVNGRGAGGKEAAERQIEALKQAIEKLPERQREAAKKDLERLKEQLEKGREREKKGREREKDDD